MVALMPRQPCQEQLLRFGADQRLLGVLTLPVGQMPQRAVILPNTGLDPRTGPNRMHVDVARALAAAGHAVLRFDLGGLGDSDAPRGEAASAARDLQDAMTELTVRGLGSQFALLGDCSGAHDAYQAALADPRAVALFLIDGYCFDTPRHERRRLKERFGRGWDKIGEWFSGDGDGDKPAFDLSIFQTPDEATVARGYQQLLDRQVQLAFLFTGDIAREYSYDEQHYDSFPFLRGRSQLWYLPQVDHTLTRRSGREAVLTRILQWLEMSAVKAKT